MKNGDAAARYSTVRLAERVDDLEARVDEGEERTDALIADLRVANSGIRSLSETLGHVSEAVIRIETRLGLSEQEIVAARRLAERASDSQEYFIDRAELDLAEKKLAIERQKELDAVEAERRRDSLMARRDRRQVFLDGLRGAGRWVIAGGPVVILVATVLLRACGFDVVGEALGK